RLDRAERQDEGERAGERRQVEGAGRQQRHDRALLAEGPADQRVDRDQQTELGQVGAQPQLYRGTGRGPARRRRPGRCRAGGRGGGGAGGGPGRPGRRRGASAPSGGPPVITATAVCPARSRTLAAVVARSPCPHIVTTGRSRTVAAWPVSAPSSMLRAPGR